MLLKKWEELPDRIRSEAVRPYYDALSGHKADLLLKRVFDVAVATGLSIALAPLALVIAIAIKIDSRGGVLYRQSRATAYGRTFQILKFRTMDANAEKSGPQLTLKGDRRITRIGKLLRKYRLDEIPQLCSILSGDMTFVGTRPEVLKYVERYTPQMHATLLLPAGVTSEASILFKDECLRLDAAQNIDEVYLREILPEKMRHNLRAIEEFSIGRDVRTLFRTVLSMFGRSSR